MASTGSPSGGAQAGSTEDNYAASGLTEIALRRRRSIPPPLVINDSSAFHGANHHLASPGDPLTEFAILATSPRSPLVQRNLPIRKRAFSFCCSESASSTTLQPLTPSLGILSPASSIHSSSEEIKLNAISTSTFTPPPTLRQWPSNVWQCFVKGTRIRWTASPNEDWHLAEELGFRDSLVKNNGHRGRMSLRGLRVVSRDRSSEAQFSGVAKLAFSYDNAPNADIVVECALDHPFFVKDKGWSSSCPELTSLRYGISCRNLECNDVCLPTSQPEASLTSDILKSFDFTPEDTSAVYTLSSMAKRQQRQDILQGTPVSPPTSPTKQPSGPTDNSRPKRPMNGFMLFAKKYRVEYTQLHPGKDNRAISVLLGDTWKRMRIEERNVFADEARLLAEQQKKLFPDCWKRKRWEGNTERNSSGDHWIVFQTKSLAKAEQCSKQKVKAVQKLSADSPPFIPQKYKERQHFETYRRPPQGPFLLAVPALSLRPIEVSRQRPLVAIARGPSIAFPAYLWHPFIWYPTSSGTGPPPDPQPTNQSEESLQPQEPMQQDTMATSSPDTTPPPPGVVSMYYRLCSEPETDEIVVHQVDDSGSECGSEDVDTLGHRYEGNGTRTTRQVSLATEILRATDTSTPSNTTTCVTNTHVLRGFYGDPAPGDHGDEVKKLNLSGIMDAEGDSVGKQGHREATPLIYARGRSSIKEWICCHCTIM